MINTRNTQRSPREARLAILTKLGKSHFITSGLYRVRETEKGVYRIQHRDTGDYLQVIFVEHEGFYNTHIIPVERDAEDLNKYRYPVYIITREKDVYGYAPKSADLLDEVSKLEMIAFLNRIGLDSLKGLIDWA
ncbi:hypothetical protein [Campylobacter curvus]|uniref:hypothetical protein n=1 Tax=Campylobacter curvus TaxID=200 RepID=UPI00146FFA04|nr:hypothetical protein [Campylobacter curvus]